MKRTRHMLNELEMEMFVSGLSCRFTALKFAVSELLRFLYPGVPCKRFSRRGKGVRRSSEFFLIFSQKVFMIASNCKNWSWKFEPIYSSTFSTCLKPWVQSSILSTYFAPPHGKFEEKPKVGSSYWRSSAGTTWNNQWPDASVPATPLCMNYIFA